MMDKHGTLRTLSGCGFPLILLVIAAILGSTHQLSKCRCGQNIGSRIIHGKPVARGDIPWMAAIVMANDQENIYCGGTLLTRRFVMTAYHCAKRDPVDYAILLGSIHLDKPDSDSKYVYVSKIIQYQPVNHNEDNDLALMKLTKAVRLNAFIQPICLPPLDEVFSNVQAVVSGWGETNQNVDVTGASNYTNLLLSGVVNVTSTDNCNKVMARYKRPVGDEMLCAGAHDGQPDHCYGDSGGPLTYYSKVSEAWEIIGIVSSAYQCADVRDYSYYVNVSHFRDWIQDNTGYNDC